MFDTLVVCYLYLGGSGAALVALLCLADCLYRRRKRMGTPALAWADELSPRFFARGHAVAFAALAVGVLCLVADLGRPERFFFVFAFPTASVLTFGSVVLGLALACTAYLAAVAGFGLARAPSWSIELAEWVGMGTGVATAVYTGVLFVQLANTALWNPALPSLFACSSFSVAAAGATCCLFPLDEAPGRLVGALARTGLACVALEALSFAAYLAVAAAGNPELLGAFVFGEDAGPLWGGFVLAGLLLPAAFGAAHRATGLRRFVGASLPFVLVGGFFLRYCIVNAPLF